MLNSISLWSKKSSKGLDYFTGRIKFDALELSLNVVCFNTNKKKEKSTDIHGLVKSPDDPDLQIGTIFLWENDRSENNYDYSGKLILTDIDIEDKYKDCRIELSINNSDNPKAPYLVGELLEPKYHKSRIVTPIKNTQDTDILDSIPF